MLRRHGWLGIIASIILIGCGPKPPKEEWKVEWLKKEIEGRVIGEDDEEVGGIEVCIVQNGHRLLSVKTTRKGYFRFDRVPKGIFELMIVGTKEWEGTKRALSKNELEGLRYSNRIKIEDIKISRRKTRLVGYVYKKVKEEYVPMEGVEVRAQPDPENKLIGKTDENGKYVIVLGDEFNDEYVISVAVGDSVATSTNTWVRNIRKLCDNEVEPIIVEDPELIRDIEDIISKKAYPKGSGKQTTGE